MRMKKVNARQILSRLRAAWPKRKKRRTGKTGARRKIRLILLVLNLLLLGGGAIWYAFQPQERQEEVRFLCRNYFARNRDISLPELAFDIWNIYYGRGFVACDYGPGQDPVYGGLPQQIETGATAGLRVFRNQGYVVGYDEIRRTPVWVAYRLFDVQEEPQRSERPESFQVDKRSLAKVRSEDYTGSGFDRGHLAPNYGIARCYGPQAQEETFLMTNIVPQRHAFNAGIWKTLEMREAVNFPGRCREIWVLTGPVFLNSPARELPSGLPVPDAFFKIMFDEQEGRVRSLAFLFDHNADAKRPLADFLCSIDQIEELTGMDFCPQLPEAVQRELESQVSTRCW